MNDTNQDNSVTANATSSLDVLRALMNTTTEVVEAEKDIGVEQRREIRHLQEAHNEVLTAEKEAHQAKVDAIKALYEEKLGAVIAEIEADFHERRDVYENERDRILDESETVELSAREELDQAIFLIESVYEGEKDKLNKQYEKLRNTIEGHQHTMQTMVTSARQAIVNAGATPPPDPEPLENDKPATPDPVKEYRNRCTQVDELVDVIESLTSSKLKRGLSFVFTGIIGALSLLLLGAFLMQVLTTWIPAAAAGGVFLLMILVIWVNASNAKRTLIQAYPELCIAVDKAIRAGDWYKDVAIKRINADIQPHLKQRNEDIEAAKTKYAPLIKQAKAHKQVRVSKMQGGHEQHLADFENQKNKLTEQNLQERDAEIQTIQQKHDEHIATLEKAHQAQIDQINKVANDKWEELRSRWFTALEYAKTCFDKEYNYATAAFPDYSDDYWQNWTASQTAGGTIPIGNVDIDLTTTPAGIPQSEELKTDLPTSFKIPASLSFPSATSLLIKANRAGRDQANALLQATMLKLLATVPPGQAHFTLIDPVDLGQNFAGFMHLADFENSIVGKRIWTEQAHIDQQLNDLTEHMENVIQKYLRNEYNTIDEYNRHAGELAEPYRFIVIADFPVNFSDDSIKRLKSIVSSGPRCGVYTLIAYDQRQPLPSGHDIEDFIGDGLFIAQRDDHFELREDGMEHFPLIIDKAPPEQFLSEILQKIGHAADQSNRIEVPFDTITPEDENLWTSDCSKVLSIPVGRAGATRMHNVVFGKGIAQHALVAGKTGSGKSSLLHAIVTNLALWFSPDEVQFYLIDFKKGVEFKSYAIHDLPHAQGIAIESDREFGLSILQKLDAEMQRRGDLFRDMAVQDLSAYRQTDNPQIMPRLLLIVDEFQEMFTEDDKTAQEASLLLDRLVRQGRAFGVHVLLGTQTLAGAYGLARSTIEQMAIRIALQCSEADSELILGDNNNAARLLSRPGEAIYNDAGGLIESNAPFQVAWLSDRDRESALKKVSKHAQAQGYERKDPLIVFEGNAPADISKNSYIQRLKQSVPPAESAKPPIAYLGEPIAIKPPTGASMRKQAGTNLLVIGQREEPALAMLISSATTLAMQHPAQHARFIIMDGSTDDSPLHNVLPQLEGILNQQIEIVAYRETESILSRLVDEMNQRQDNEGNHPPVYILMYGMQRYRNIRKQEDDFSFSFSDDEDGATPGVKPDKAFADLLREGPSTDIHILAWCDSLATLNRTLDRQMIREFDQRVLFQMSAADSSQLIDTPAASKLGLHRAVYFSEENGTLEKFRPFDIMRPDALKAYLDS